MLKRVMLFLTALAALTASAAPAAQAGAVLTDSNKKAVVQNSEVTMSSSNMKMTTSSGTIACGNVTVHGILAENFPRVRIVITTTTTAECKTSGLLPTTITEPEIEFIEFDEGFGLATGTFKYDIPAVGLKDCHFEGFPEFTYESGSSTVSLPGSPYVAGGGSPPGCPTTGITHGSFSLSDALGAVTIH